MASRRINGAESFDCDWLEMTVGCRSGIFVYIPKRCLLRYILILIIRQLRLQMRADDPDDRFTVNLLSGSSDL